MALTKDDLKRGIVQRDATIAHLNALLNEIEAQGDMDLTASDLAQHNRHAGTNYGLRIAADIARKRKA